MAGPTRSGAERDVTVFRHVTSRRHIGRVGAGRADGELYFGGFHSDFGDNPRPLWCVGEEVRPVRVVSAALVRPGLGE